MAVPESALDQLVQRVARARHVVALTGAGLSTDSGVPDFRGPEGVWTRRDRGLPPPPHRPLDRVEPNAGHHALVALHRAGRLHFVVTQNVDDLHRRSGLPEEVLAELHGNLARGRCPACAGLADLALARCPRCAQPLVSSVVEFGDPLPREALAHALHHAQRADLFLALGSSLQVSPANELPRVALASGAQLVIVNQGATRLDRLAHLRLDAGLTQVLPALVDGLQR